MTLINKGVDNEVLASKYQGRTRSSGFKLYSGLIYMSGKWCMSGAGFVSLVVSDSTINAAKKMLDQSSG